MSLKAINLNLIPVLRELLRLRSVSAAGRALGRSSSAVSEGLAQLRQSFGDPLLVRAQGGMILTPRALELVGQVDLLCTDIEEMFAAHSFDPAATDRLFTIAAHDFHVFSLGPRLIALFEGVAPGFTLRFTGLGPDLPQRLAAREVDFAMMPDFQLNEFGAARFRHMDLMTDRTVVLMRVGHPLAESSAIDRDQLRQYKQIAFHPDWEPIEYRKATLAFRRNLPIHARVTQITTLPFFLPGTDFIALVPDSLAERTSVALDLVHRPLAREEPPVQSVLAWSPIQDADPAHCWFRDRIASQLLAVPSQGQNPST